MNKSKNPTNFDQFSGLAKNLFSVPKPEIQPKQSKLYAPQQK